MTSRIAKKHYEVLVRQIPAANLQCKRDRCCFGTLAILSGWTNLTHEALR